MLKAAGSTGNAEGGDAEVTLGISRHDGRRLEPRRSHSLNRSGQRGVLVDQVIKLPAVMEPRTVVPVRRQEAPEEGSTEVKALPALRSASSQQPVRWRAKPDNGTVPQPNRPKLARANSHAHREPISQRELHGLGGDSQTVAKVRDTRSGRARVSPVP